jgi:tryptophan halogenase
MKTVNSILVAGAGTAGIVSALILKKKLNIQVDIVHSKTIGIIGVGEGSTEHWRDFMDFVGIDQQELIRECDATYKCGIMFENWGDKNYLHSVAPPFNKKFAQYSYVYGRQVANNDPFVASDISKNNNINPWFLENPKEFPFNQFHFNTNKLNAYLTKLAKEAGINIIEDEITDVNIGKDGSIDYVTGEKQTYTYDFYIDSTGFKRPLMNKLGAKWTSYSKYLKMKSAIVFPTEDEDNYNIWTLSRAMDYGWLFRIPTWGRYGNGYIYDSDYITADQAKAEVEKYFGREITVGKQINFDPGALDRVWVKNCCAVGLSASFVEPLEASSIGTSIQQAFILMHRLANYDQNVIDNYNKAVTEILENIRDFVILHYQTKKTNTEFWKDCAKLEIPDSLKSKLALWKNKLPIQEDFSNLTAYVLFTAANFILVMDGLDLFDRDAIRKEYESNPEYIKQDADVTVKNELMFEKSIATITHKELIRRIREGVTKIVPNTADSFKSKGYCVVKSVISPEIRDLATQYALFDEMQDFTPDTVQVKAAHSKYADPMMETILLQLQPILEKHTGLTLLPTYSFYRVYRNGDELVNHKDRPSCEISATICFNYSYSDEEYSWPIYMNGNPVGLMPGDMVIYRGCDLDHWRSPMSPPGDDWQVQAFFHFVDANGPYTEYKFDKRASIGEDRSKDKVATVVKEEIPSMVNQVTKEVPVSKSYIEYIK